MIKLYNLENITETEAIKEVAPQVKCENCKFWSQESSQDDDLKEEMGICSKLKDTSWKNFYVETEDSSITSVNTHRNFGCALFEQK